MCADYVVFQFKWARVKEIKGQSYTQVTEWDKGKFAFCVLVYKGIKDVVRRLYRQIRWLIVPSSYLNKHHLYPCICVTYWWKLFSYKTLLWPHMTRGLMMLAGNVCLCYFASGSTVMQKKTYDDRYLSFWAIYTLLKKGEWTLSRDVRQLQMMLHHV